MQNAGIFTLLLGAYMPKKINNMINKKPLYGVLLVLFIVAVLVFSILTKKNQSLKQSPADYSTTQIISQQKAKDPRLLQEIITLTDKTTLTGTESTEWKTYDSKYLGISFRYPQGYLVREFKDGNGIIGQLSGSIDILPDLPNVREALEMRPGDGYIPLHMKISRSQIFESAQFSKNYFRSLRREECCSTATMIFGGEATISFKKEIEQGIGVSEIIEFPRGRYIYSAEISYIDPKERKRIDYYKILSTIEFGK